MEEIWKLIDEAILGTSENHPDWDMGKQMEVAIFRYIKEAKEGNLMPDKRFCAHFSPKLKTTGKELRNPILDCAEKMDYDVALGFLDQLYRYGTKKIKEPNITNEESKQLTGFINTYLHALSRATFDKNKYFFATGRASPLNCVKDKIYDDPTILEKFVSKTISDIRTKDTFLSNVSKMYLDDIREKKKSKSSSIEIIEVFDSAKEVLTNVTESKIVNSYSGSILNGKITVASDRGYIDKPNRPQQDAVFSMAKSEDCSLSIVADGAGGSLMGEFASMSIIQKFADWYKDINEEDLKSLNTNEIAQIIDNKLIQVNNEIHERYNGKSYSTVALALCVGDNTIVANIGDSMVYSYDETTDELVEISKLDSVSKGLSYEQARHNPYNNMITNAIGLSHVEGDKAFAHYALFKNEGEKIIISSDGVTDLISERNFKNYFKKNANADEIVKDAVYRPDIVTLVNDDGTIEHGKSADNVSAIVIQLPNNYQNTDNKSGRRL